jgi:hypothetical protein
MMFTDESVAMEYARRFGTEAIRKDLPTPRIRLPIPEDAKNALKAVEEHTNLMMANRKAGKAEIKTPGTEGGALSLGRYPGTLGQASVKSLAVKGVVYPPRTDALGHENGRQSDSIAPAPDTKPPSVFPLSDIDKLKIDIATLEETIKDLRMELNDKDYTIKGMKAEIAKLREA